MKLNKLHEGSIVSKIKSVSMDEESEELIIEGYANTTTKDRAGDIIPKSAWEMPSAMGNYSKNPIILAYHDHSNPVGRMMDYFVDDKGLNIKAKISKGAGRVYQLIKDGIISTFSVGFMIKDAEYLSKTDTYMINELELLEVSVVSVPCNQDSTFSVSKSLKDSEAFKQELLPSTKADDKDSKDKENIEMTIEKNKPTDNPLTLEAVEKLMAEREQKRIADEEAKKAAEQAKKDQEAAMKEAAKEAAKSMVADLEAKMAEGSESFAKALKDREAEVEALHDEIKQLTAQRSKNFSYNKVTEAGFDREARKSANDAVLLGIVTEKGTFGTKFGEQVKAVNQSSSIEVSSEAYETVFSTDLIRDIQAELVIAPLFRDITMTSANLTIPVNPDRKNASWVSGAQYGTDNSSGGEVTAALTEITLKTMKLAAKSYITDETSEDAIIPLLPLIRMHLVEAHANEIDRAFLLGTGTGEPLGLVPRATAAEASGSAGKAGGVETSTATSNGATPITAKMILKARKKMKLYGLNVRDVSLVVSTECYYALIEDDAWADVNLVGGAATKLNGQVGSIYGMPVLVSDHFEAPALSSAYAVLVNTKNFIVPTQRSVTVRTDFDVEKDRRVIVATQRLNLESLIRDTTGADKGVVAVTYAAA